MMANAQKENERHFQSVGHADMINFNWEIKDFLTLMKMNTLKYNYLEFNAGQSFGLPSRWRFQLSTTADNRFRLDLHLLKCSTPSVLVHFKWCIKQANGTNYCNHEAEMQQGEQGCELKEGNSAQSRFGTWNLGELMASLPQTLKDGSLNIQIRFWLSTDSSFKTQETRTDANTKLSEEIRLAVLEDFQKFLDSGENTDIVIAVKDGKKLKAHQAILAARSPVFLAMFKNKMKEASSGVVSIENISYEAMGILLKFIYSGSMDYKWVEFAEEIVDAAEKYSLGHLKTICDQTLIRGCYTENAMDLLKVAQLYKLEIAEENIIAFIESNVRQVLKKDK